MSMPHCFPSLTEGPSQVVLIVGTGLSKGNAPTVDELGDRLTNIATTMGVLLPKKGGNDFYALAEAVLQKRTSDHGTPEQDSRLWLAEELGLFDRRWFGETGVPLSGNTPRHRAIARFAVEQRVKAIVSLNWDTWMEFALESVGLSEGNAMPRPWTLTTHARIVDVTDSPRLADLSVFPVIKPHGCVRNLERVRRVKRSTGTTPSFIFKVTKTDLENLPLAQQSLIDKGVQVYLSQCPLIAVGWKASEKYLRDAVAETARNVQPTLIDSFTLINRSWYPSKDKNLPYHGEVAAAYKTTKEKSWVAVGDPTRGDPTIDQLFQWLQARYAMTQLIAVASSPQRERVRGLLGQLDTPDLSHPIVSWVDRWLSTWVKMCWRAGIVRGINLATNRPMEPWDIPVVPRDFHVPWGRLGVDRLDLLAAARLLSEVADSLIRFDLSKFPGGFWNAEDRCLYLPLPGWRGTGPIADLAALKPMVEAISGFGFVRAIRLVWLNAAGSPRDSRVCKELEAQLQRQMKLTHFAGANSISWVDLDVLKGDLP